MIEYLELRWKHANTPVKKHTYARIRK